MEDQSPHVSTTHDAPEPDHQQQLYREAEEPQPYAKPWDDDDDVLDLTGGQYNHPAFNVTFPTKPAEAEEDKHSYSDSLEQSPESEEPSSIGSDVPRAPIIPSAPVEEHDTPVSPYGAPTSGSVDVNLFPLPASSAPLMQSSADNVMDLQQPSSTQPDGKEDLSSLLFESTTTLPSLSPLSPDYLKEHTGTIAFSADSATPEALQSYAAETEFIEEKDQKYMFGVGGIKEDAIFSDRGFAVEHPTSQQEYVPVDHEKMYTQSAKEMFSGMLKSVVPPHEEFSDLKEGADEHYVDFKPFVSTGVLDLGYEFKEKAADVKSDLSNWDFESIKPEGKYFEEKDIDISDDISPASPEAISESSSYETFAPLQKTAPFAYGGNPFADHKFEKGVEELETGPKTHLGSNVATVNPFLEHLDKESDYVTTDRVSANVAAQAPSKTEGLTPDIVQEAYESEVYDDGVPKLNYEPKIDLVQTIATASQENIPPTPQNTGMFEDSDSVSSPVLPDIVMEAPLTSASQPDVSTAGPVGMVREEKIKFESEKPPSYEDTVNRASFREQEPAEVRFEPVKAAQAEEVEAQYISIACDLIKETIPEKVTDFPKALKSDFDSQYTAYDESSPESEPSEPSYKHWETEVISCEAATTISSVKSHDFTLEKEKESDQKWNEEVSSKAYLESETCIFDTNMSAKEPVKPLSSQEKPLQMEAFGKTVYSEEAPRITKPVYFEKPSALPFVEEFVLKPSKEDQVEDKKHDDFILKDEPKKTEDLHPQQKPKERVQEFDNLADFSKASEIEETISKPAPPTKGADVVIPSSTGKEQPPAPPAKGACYFKTPVVDLLYWRDIKKSGLVFGASLFLLLSLTVFSIVSVSAYIALALLSVTISFRIYKGVLQAIQKSEEGHPFKSCLDSNVQVSEELVNKYSNLALGHVNCTLKELRRLFLVEDLVDSLKFAVLMWVFTYIGALFNGLTLLILALISLFSIPVLYERHQTKVDHYLGIISKNFNNIRDLILTKIPGLKRKTE